MRWLTERAGRPRAGGQAWAVNERQAEALQRAAEALRCAGASAADGLPLDFWALDLRGALLARGNARPPVRWICLACVLSHVEVRPCQQVSGWQAISSCWPWHGGRCSVAAALCRCKGGPNIVLPLVSREKKYVLLSWVSMCAGDRGRGQRAGA